MALKKQLYIKSGSLGKQRIFELTLNLIIILMGRLSFLYVNKDFCLDREAAWAMALRAFQGTIFDVVIEVIG